MDKTKRLAIIIPVAVLAIVAAGWFLISNFVGAGAESVNVETVASVIGVSGGIHNRFAGIVEAQAKLELYFTPERLLSRRYVEVGDEVSEGQALFSYDTMELEYSLEQMNLDVQRIENTITATNGEIAILKKQRETAASSLQLEYTTQIKSFEAQVKQEEFNLRVKRLEIDKIRDQIDNSIVRSTLDGVVQSVNEVAASSNKITYYDPNQDLPYMTVITRGDFRVRGDINEHNIRDLSNNAPVIVRSRIDDNASWAGVVDYIDYESPTQGRGTASSGGDTLNSSKYPFYVTLPKSANLLLGQHVYIEPDIAEMEREGIWLLEYFVVTNDGEPYVWAANSRDKLEKRRVTLGEHDRETRCYEIVQGLGITDEIAWPDVNVRAGMNVERGNRVTPPQLPDPPASEDADDADDLDDVDNGDTVTGDEGNEETGDAGEPSDVSEPPETSGEEAMVPSAPGRVAA